MPRRCTPPASARRLVGCQPGARASSGKRQRRAALQRAQHRDQGHRHHQRHADGDRHGQCLVAEQLPGDALHEHQRQEHRDRGERGRDHRHAHFAGADDRRLEDAQPAFARLGDRLEHHDGVVDHQARGQRQAAQRHHVEAQAQLPHEEERGDDRHRQRQRDHERAPAIAQEQEDDQDRQQAADHRVQLDVADGIADEDRLVFDGVTSMSSGSCSRIVFSLASSASAVDTVLASPSL
jgi:hypothetical protein